MSTQGLIFAIERTSLHDGPGLRTTVFLKGCPLRCLWCHNPESQTFSKELYFFQEKCLRCGICVHVCPKNCHAIINDEHEINRANCIGCGKCVDACPYSVLELKGEMMDASTVVAAVEEDRDFYESSGGGMTVSGGEPLAQFEFTNNLFTLAKKRGIHTCLETSGFAPTEEIIKIKDNVDIFLYDFKESDPKRHLQYTGVDNTLILKNLFELDRLGSKIVLRCPIIPGMNDQLSHLQEIGKLAQKLENILEVNIMPYHPFGKSKSKRIGKVYPLEGIDFVEKVQADKWIKFIKENTDVPVKKG
ncbi:MAG TPA: glycyl-radical enzyme activating protein [Clostridiaceae bacterium]